MMHLSEKYKNEAGKKNMNVKLFEQRVQTGLPECFGPSQHSHPNVCFLHFNHSLFVCVLQGYIVELSYPALTNLCLRIQGRTCMDIGQGVG